MRRLFITISAMCAIFPALAQQHQQHQHAEHQQEQEQAQQYVCPMHPEVIKDHPGECPICGMDLVAKQSQQNMSHSMKGNMQSTMSPAAPTFDVNEQQQRALRVTTVAAERKSLQPKLVAQGQVAWQQSAQYHVHPRAEGWVEQLYADVEGQWVEQGAKLYQIYSPELVVAQDDYLQLLDSLSNVGNSTEQQRFKERGQRRLKLLGMTDQQISQLEQTQQTRYRIDYFAPQAGYVTQLNIQKGMYVKPGSELMTISGSEQRWVLLDVPARYSEQLAEGQMVHLSSDQLKGHWMNRIDYIYPNVDASTQTITARVPLTNNAQVLKEGFWLTGHIELAELPESVVIPVQSLIQAQSSSRVMVKTGPQQFAVKAVTVGQRVGDEVTITTGLSAGEQVVTNGQFLLDSEAALRGLLPDSDAVQAGGHQHGGH